MLFVKTNHRTPKVLKVWDVTLHYKSFLFPSFCQQSNRRMIKKESIVTFEGDMLHFREFYGTLFTQSLGKFSVRRKKTSLLLKIIIIIIGQRGKLRDDGNLLEEKEWDADRSVESLMDPLRWACSSTFGIDTNHSIFLLLLLFLCLFPSLLLVVLKNVTLRKKDDDVLLFACSCVYIIYESVTTFDCEL